MPTTEHCVSGRRLLRVTCVTLAVLSAGSCSGDAELPSLGDAFRQHFLIGAALNDDEVSGRDAKAVAIVLKHCNSVTAENVMKWVHIHPRPDAYDFAAADRFVAFSEKHNMFVAGHALIWHDQIPAWTFVDEQGKLLGRDAMLQRMRQHIETVVGRYKGRVKGWDVVNEALTDEGGLRQSLWVRTVGEDFVAKAFEYTNQVDPGAELYYNDFSLDKPAKRDAAVLLVKDLKARGLRIDAVGIQGHWGMDYPTDGDLEDFILAVGRLGVKVLVTEMDMNILPAAWDYDGADINMRAELRKELNPYPETLPDSMQKVLTDRYGDLFAILVRHAATVDRVTFWGVTDRTSWLNDWPVRGRTSYPLLFDRNYQPKPAFYAVLHTAGSAK
jgi:endo-1,4-beta-xylanase